MTKAPRAQNNPFSGIGYFLRGLALIKQKGVKRYVAIPLLINVVLFAGAIYYGSTQLGQLMAWLEDKLPGWLDWLSWLLLPLFVVAVVLIVFFGFAVIGNLIAAPFNGLLAEAVEMKLRGQPLESGGGWRKLAREFFSSLASELRKLLYFTIRAVPLLVLMLVPGVNIIATGLWLVFSAWMLAVEYADYPMANHGLTFPRQRRLLASRRFLTLGFGGAMTVMLMIPFLNFLLIPAGVAGATAMWVDQLSHAAAEEQS